MPEIAKLIAAAPVRLYRAAISPLLAPACRFHPTCSSYALEAIERHGALKGFVLAGLRLMRCHPWYRKSFTDPVPEAFAWGGLIRYKRGQDRRQETTGKH